MAKIVLTDRKVQSLKAAPKGKRYQVMDALVPGFGVRVTDKAVKTYIFQARFPGSANPARREINKDTLETARDVARAWSALVKQGIDPVQIEEKAKEEQARVSANTFGAIADDYFARKLAKQRSGNSVWKRIENNLLPVFKDRPVAQITDLDILAKVVNPRVIGTPAMARQLFNDLGGFFSWLIDQRIYGLKVSPCATIKISKIVGRIAPRQRVLNDDEIRALWIAATRLPYPIGPIYRGLLLSALRVREFANTDRPEWSLRGNFWEWTIPAARMKGKIAHVVPVTADLREIYDACPQRGRFLFSFDGGETPIRVAGRMKKQIDAGMLKVLREIALERGDDPELVVLAHWTNHDIRRTVRTRLSRLRVPEEAREAILAHVRPGIKGVYDLHDYLEEKRQGLELWAAKLRDIVEPPRVNVVPLRQAAVG
jgi:integrase